MTPAERRAVRRRVDRTRCPECRKIHLEILDINGPAVLCPECGWSTTQLKETDGA